MTRTSLMRRRNRPTNDPFTSMQRLFDDLMRPMTVSDWDRESLNERAWRPAVDISETDTHFRVTAELPGLTKDDVEVTFENGTLTLSGERKFEEKKEEGNFHRIERLYGAFSRSFVLPSEVDGDKVEAHFENGLLTVAVPKSERAKPRRIEIR